MRQSLFATRHRSTNKKMYLQRLLFQRNTFTRVSHNLSITCLRLPLEPGFKKKQDFVPILSLPATEVHVSHWFQVLLFCWVLMWFAPGPIYHDDTLVTFDTNYFPCFVFLIDIG